VDDDHRVRVPRLARHLVANTAPEVDNFFPAVIDTAGATQLVAASEVFLERVAYGLEAVTDVSFYSL
jgi:hypothetical protein